MTDLDAVLEELGAAGHVRYDPLDRYREFRETFLADDRGRRVLNEILSLAHVNRPSVTARRPIDALEVMVREGERNMALAILAILHTEPPDRPASAVSVRPEGE